MFEGLRRDHAAADASEFVHSDKKSTPATYIASVLLKKEPIISCAAHSTSTPLWSSIYINTIVAIATTYRDR